VNQNDDDIGDGMLQDTFTPGGPGELFTYWWFYEGTSMAAPHVSGVAALLIVNGVTTADDVRFGMQSTAEDKGSARWDAEYGWGIVDAYAALNADLTFTLSDEVLMTFDDTFVSPFAGWADLVGKADVPGLGVQYHIALYGVHEIELGIGERHQADWSAYTNYSLTFTNTSVNDTFNVKLYLKTGAEETYYRSGSVPLLPGVFAQPYEMTWDLSGVSNLDDVREIGFAVSAWMGGAFGMADEIRVKVEPTVGNLH